jgi:hypothetical protein
MSATGAAQQPRPVGPPAARPVVVAAVHRDTSLPLRDIQPVAPAQRHAPGDREPRFLRPIRRERTPDPLVQSAPGAAAMVGASQSFDGVGNVNGVLPPDTNAAVGPNHYVQSVNVSFAIYSKEVSSTAPVPIYGPAQTSTLWTGFGGPCEARNDGDAIVLYDQLADRWVMSQLALPNLFFGIALAPFYQCIAVSATPDPTGAYHRYQFPFNKLNDYPKLGVWPDAYYMAINQFSAVSLQFAGQGVIAFDRQKMLAGLPATMQYIDLASADMTLAGMLPATVDGAPPPAGSPGYFVQMDDDAWGYSDDRLQLWRFSVNWLTPAASSFTLASTLPVAPFDTDMCNYSRNCIPQRGTAVRVDAMADRLMYRLQYRNMGTHESLVVNQTVDADGTDHAAVRWYEVRNPRTSPVLWQQGTYAPDGDHRWMASAAMDGAGNLAVGFSVAGTATYPSVRYTGRLATDAPGIMTQGEAELVAGSGAQTHESGRWGDYSTLAVDPSDDCTFWYTQQYYAATSSLGWRTRIGTFSFPSCGSSSSLPRVTVTATSAAREQGPTSGLFTVSRTGDTSNPLTVTYTVGGTATPSTDYTPLTGVVVIPAGAASAPIAVNPLDDQFAEPDETIAVTVNASADYVAASPSQAVITLVSDDLPADLVITAVTVPAAAAPGAVVSVGDSTKNQGGGAASGSTTAFYLSANLILDAADRFLGSRSVAPLVTGAVDSGTTMVSIPAATTTGTYYVLARADSGNVVPETNDSNNVKFSAAMSVGPDLAVAASVTPAITAAGAVLTITDTTRNQGSVTAGASTTGFYLSANALLDAADALLGTRAVGALAPGAVSSSSSTVTLPPGLATGLYYVFAKADAFSSVVESSEVNNASSALIVRVGADLVLSALTAVPSGPAAGGTITISDTTTNSGGGSAAASTTRFYLSVNLAVDATDIVLGSRGVPALGAATSSPGSTAVVIPAGTAPGSYWLIAVADAPAVIAETSETNNTRLIVITVR